MKRLMALIVAAAMVLAILLPTLADAADDEHPHRTLAHHGRVHGIVKDTDASSFKKAVAWYPAGGRRRFSVAMGSYLMWSIVNKFPTRTRVGRLWLHAYRQVCATHPRRPGLAGVQCSIFVDLRVRKGRRVYRAAFARRSIPVGAWFDPHNNDYRGAVRAAVRKPVDMAIDAITGRLVRAGVVPQD